MPITTMPRPPVSGDGDVDADVAPPTPPSAPSQGPLAARPDPPTTTAGSARERRCEPISGPTAADVDGDGCPDAVRIEGQRVTVGPTTWVVGRSGDSLAVADWDCDGRATAAALRRDTGEVFVFDRWVDTDAELTVPTSATVAGAHRLVAVDDDGDGCAQLTVERTDLPPLSVDVSSPP